MAFLKLAKLAAGGAASFFFLSGHVAVARADQETQETNCDKENTNEKTVRPALPQVYFILKQGNSLIGTIVMELRSDIVPKTAENFRILCRGDHSYGYKFTSFHRVVPGFIIQGGDVLRLKGTCSKSIYQGGGYFPDENFELKHDEAGVLSMANKGPHTNGSQFFILTGPAPHLDGKHVVFGKVIRGLEVVRRIEETGNQQEVTIIDCGEIKI